MHLTDYFLELITYVLYFQRTVVSNQPQYEQVKADIDLRLNQSEVCLNDGQFSRDDYDQARFMICAWVDEVVLNSSWNQKNLWQGEPLQLRRFDTVNAGEVVFEKLNTLGPHQREVREVYYLCLSLGFRGRYCRPGDEHLLRKLKESHLKLLTGSSVGLPSLDLEVLFPEAYPGEDRETIAPRRTITPVSIACFAGPVIFFGLLLLIYRLVLSGVGNNS